jgi:ATP-dependent DNA ligase
VQRVPLIVEAVDRLKVRSCLIDGEAVACDENGLAVFEQLRRKPAGKHVFLYYAFDLLELDGQDLRRELRRWALSKKSGRQPRPLLHGRGRVDRDLRTPPATDPDQRRCWASS